MAKPIDELSTRKEAYRQPRKNSRQRGLSRAVNKPLRLQPGARVGIVAPAGCVGEEALHLGIAAIKAEGFEVEVAAHVYDRKGYLAGDEKRRALELKNFFQRSDIDGIFCARGGFGSIQLLSLFKSGPEPISKNICRLQRYNNFN